MTHQRVWGVVTGVVWSFLWSCGSGSEGTTPGFGTGGASATGGALLGGGGSPVAGAGGLRPEVGGQQGVGGDVAAGAGGAAGAPGTGGLHSGTGGQLAGAGGDAHAGAPPVVSGGTPSIDGGEAGAAFGGMPSRADLGKGDGSDVITIGDSWMSLGFTGIQQSLVRVSAQPYRTYGVAGTQLLNGQIPGQYERAKRENPDIKTVVMTGGGNDVLLTGLSTDCANGGQRCIEQLIKIGEGLEELWTQMSADGVQDVIHVLYSQDAGQGVNVDTGDGLQKICADVPPPLRCHLLPTDDLVMGQFLDGIHPTSAANGRIAEAIVELMVREGMRR